MLELSINKLNLKTEDLTLNLNDLVSRFSTTNIPETGLVYELGLGAGFEVAEFAFYNKAQSQLTLTADYLAPLDMAKLMLVDTDNLDVMETTLTKLAQNIGLKLNLQVDNTDPNQISDAITLTVQAPQNAQQTVMDNPLLWLMGAEFTGKLSLSPNTVMLIDPDLEALNGIKNQLPAHTIVQWNEQGYVITIDKEFLINMMMGL